MGVMVKNKVARFLWTTVYSQSLVTSVTVHELIVLANSFNFQSVRASLLSEAAWGQESGQTLCEGKS